MKQIFAFNPEHDLALANGDRHFIAPKNIREMARDLAPLLEVMKTDEITVWGWDSTITDRLYKTGIPRTDLPTEEALAALSRQSERGTAHQLLTAFHAEHSDDYYTGKSFIIHNTEEIAAHTIRYGHILLKSPLSGSGKGLRHVKFHPIPPCKGGNTDITGPQVLPYREDLGGSVTSWANAIIRRHGYLMAEPYYAKTQDFAMEFYVDGDGCHSIGYSLFVTDHHGRYIGSHLMSDKRIEELLSSYVPRTALQELRDWIIAHVKHIIPTEWDTTRHPLHFGIDMMIVSDNQQPTDNGQQLFKIHPCVEINLRMNMGIIAHELYCCLLDSEAEGMFHLAFFADTEGLQTFHSEHTLLYPTEYRNGKLLRGYLPLTPINSETRHHAYIICR